MEKENDLIVLGLSLVVSEQARLEHKIAHVDEGPSDLSPTVSDHPSFVYDLRRHRFVSLLLKKKEEEEIAKWKIYVALSRNRKLRLAIFFELPRDQRESFLSDLIAHFFVSAVGFEIPATSEKIKRNF